jgi:alkylated DNA repair protein (DNA oxidative demethylase)
VSLPLFSADDFPQPPSRVDLAPGAVVLHRWALERAADLLAEVSAVLQHAPPRQMQTPAGLMSVAISNCGAWGWVSDRRGYRYSATDPVTKRPWPALPPQIEAAACAAAAAAGYPDFHADACLVNRYEPGARMGLHQDKNERDFSAPIVSISFGLPVQFLFGGAQRSSKVQRIELSHGDVVVWGGPSRLFYHGVAPLAAGKHPALGAARINLTLRCAS